MGIKTFGGKSDLELANDLNIFYGCFNILFRTLLLIALFLKTLFLMTLFLNNTVFDNTAFHSTAFKNTLFHNKQTYITRVKLFVVSSGELKSGKIQAWIILVEGFFVTVQHHALTSFVLFSISLLFEFPVSGRTL